MKTLVMLSVLLLGASQAGCITRSISRMTPEQQIGLVNAFAAAGCKGHVHAAVGGGVGQLGGEAHADVSVDGDCDSSRKPPPAN